MTIKDIKILKDYWQKVAEKNGRNSDQACSAFIIYHNACDQFTFESHVRLSGYTLGTFKFSAPDQEALSRFNSLSAGA